MALRTFLKHGNTNFLLHVGPDEDKKKWWEGQTVLPAREGRNEEENGQDQSGRRAAAAGGEGAEN